MRLSNTGFSDFFGQNAQHSGLETTPFIILWSAFPIILWLGGPHREFPLFKSCNSLEGRLVGFPRHLSGLRLLKVLTQGGLSTIQGVTGTSRALEFAYFKRLVPHGARYCVRHLPPDPNPVGS